jgi:hypothetical protein
LAAPEKDAIIYTVFKNHSGRIVRNKKSGFAGILFLK